MSKLENWNQYIKELIDVKDDLEHSGRTYLENLLRSFTDKFKIKLKHEPKRDKNGKGVPDFKFYLNDTDIGYLENKKIGENLDKVLKSDQIKKYQELTDNLILTDYLRWIWIYKGKISKDIRLCEKNILEQRKIQLNETACREISNLVDDFLSQRPMIITKAKNLAEKLSKPTRTIKEEIYRILSSEEYEKNSQIEGIFKVFQTEISENITKEDFSDCFAQTFTYSLFLTKITLNSADKITLYNISSITPQSFALIKDILSFINQIENYPTLKPYVECLLHIINHTDADCITQDLKTNKNEFEDPYIHFYENFLTAYDYEKRKDLGVWYTPKPIVKSIVDNIDIILKKDFNLKDSLADKNIKLLDFSCGTGTFLFEVYDKILSKIKKTSLKRKNLIQEHILKNLFGFELLIPAYCISHLKLSSHLELEGYKFEKKDRIRVYFTNTLENRKMDDSNDMFASLFPAISREGKSAQEIKDNNDILVIVGNPPYNGTSQNNFQYIKDLIKPYFPKDSIKEKNSKWLNDDYVKFIRFAENKISKAGKGIVGIITNHSFIDNPTFRAMRKHLIDTFDKIYIVDLHGNVKKKEKNFDGSADQNVFDIQQGVSINIFVKSDKIKNKGIYHLDIFGKRKEKFEEISKIHIENTKFNKINPTEPFYLFHPQNESLRKEYDKGINLRDIFLEMNVGIVTGKDKKVISFEEKSLEKKVKENFNLFDNSAIKDISYRPFDNRKIYYDVKNKGLIERARIDIMQHFINRENVGLVFTRQVRESSFEHCFISNKIINFRLTLSGSGGGYIAPLYLYQENIDKEEKKLNFQSSFINKINKKFNNPTPEETLAFIYASLYSPNYRKKYFKFLKIDFPKINFDISIDKFRVLAKIGQELIDVHLMKKIPNLSVVESEFEENKQNYIVEEINYNKDLKRLYFNKTCFFTEVSKDIWEFKIGGYQVLDKYLKSRKNMNIEGELVHIENIIKVLKFSIDKMFEIDKI